MFGARRLRLTADFGRACWDEEGSSQMFTLLRPFVRCKCLIRCTAYQDIGCMGLRLRAGQRRV